MAVVEATFQTLKTYGENPKSPESRIQNSPWLDFNAPFESSKCVADFNLGKSPPAGAPKSPSGAMSDSLWPPLCFRCFFVVKKWCFSVVFGASKNLVGGFNPSEKWRQIGSFPQVGGENIKSLKQPPRMLRAFKMTKIMEMMRTLYWWIHEHWDENLGGSTWKRGLQETTQEIESGDLWCTCMNHFGWGSINITNHETLQMSKDRDSSIPSILSLHVY